MSLSIIVASNYRRELSLSKSSDPVGNGNFHCAFRAKRGAPSAPRFLSNRYASSRQPRETRRRAYEPPSRHYPSSCRALAHAHILRAFAPQLFCARRATAFGVNVSRFSRPTLEFATPARLDLLSRRLSRTGRERIPLVIFFSLLSFFSGDVYRNFTVTFAFRFNFTLAREDGGAARRWKI